eukprot:1193209-Prorocentrum_minimum.AAC.3
MAVPLLIPSCWLYYQVLRSNAAGDAPLMPGPAVKREVEYSRRISHPNIVQLLDVVTTERNQLILVVRTPKNNLLKKK